MIGEEFNKDDATANAENVSGKSSLSIQNDIEQS